MRSSILCAILIASLFPRLCTAGELQPLPEGWEMIGIGRAGYEAGVDAQTTRLGKPAAHLRSKEDVPELPGVLAQTFDAQGYRGKRIRYRAFLKFKDVQRQACIWMWVLGPDGVISSDFMDDRVLKGDSDWIRAEVVLDVSKNAKTIVYGARLWGQGGLWVSGIQLESVGKDVPLTGGAGRKTKLPLQPVNLF